MRKLKRRAEFLFSLAKNVVTELVTGGTRITQDANRRVTQSGDVRITQ